jgi:hypothetical protein
MERTEGERTIEIRKVDGKWTVKRDDPGKKFFRGDKVTWRLFAGSTVKGVSARFQFCHPTLVEGQGLTADLTATIPPVKNSEVGELVLRVGQHAERRSPHTRHYYAVWICDADEGPFGGTYAVGETQNPPPEIDIGPEH